MKNKQPFLIIVIFFFMFSCIKNEPECDLIMQIDSNGKAERTCLEIDKVGIDERQERARINIHTTKQIIPVLKGITGKNLGKNAELIVNDERLFSGIIQEELEDGVLSIEIESIKEAISMVEKIGVKERYHWKLTPDEIKDQKFFRESTSNPWFKKASHAMDQHDYDKAVDFQKKAIKEMPADPRQYAFLSFIYYSQKDYISALEEILKAEKLIKNEDRHKFPGYYLSIGDYYTQLNNIDAAIEAYKKYLSTGKDNLLIRLNLGKVYEKSGDYDLAQKEYLILSKSSDEELNKEGMDGLRRIAEHQ